MIYKQIFATNDRTGHHPIYIVPTCFRAVCIRRGYF